MLLMILIVQIDWLIFLKKFNMIDDIIKLKMIYNDRFRQYQGDFYEYKEVIRKINDMENKIIGNKIKIELMKKKMLEKEQINEKKLVLVKQYNNQQGNNN